MVKQRDLDAITSYFKENDTHVAFVAPGPDGIPAEPLKADLDTTVEVLHNLFDKIWDIEDVYNQSGRRHSLLSYQKRGSQSLLQL